MLDIDMVEECSFPSFSHMGISQDNKYPFSSFRCNIENGPFPSSPKVPRTCELLTLYDKTSRSRSRRIVDSWSWLCNYFASKIPLKAQSKVRTGGQSVKTTSELMEQPTSPPVENLLRVTNYPNPTVTQEKLLLSSLTTNTKPTVLHLYTG